MSAYWKLKGNSPELGEIQVWWTSSRTPSVIVRHSVRGSSDGKEYEFPSFAKAEDWAIENGVTCWDAIETVRAYPFAEKLPIVFLDAPPTKVLVDVVAKFTNGEKLSDIANEISIDSGLLRYWLVGADPTNESVQGLKGKKGKKGNATANPN